MPDALTSLLKSAIKTSRLSPCFSFFSSSKASCFLFVLVKAPLKAFSKSVHRDSLVSAILWVVTLLFSLSSYSSLKPSKASPSIYVSAVVTLAYGTFIWSLSLLAALNNLKARRKPSLLALSPLNGFGAFPLSAPLLPCDMVVMD